MVGDVYVNVKELINWYFLWNMLWKMNEFMVSGKGLTMATLEEITEGMKERIGEDCGLGATLKFDFGDDGIVHVDADSVPNVVSNEDADADCTIKITKDNFEALAGGDLDPTTAFMMGKLKIEGNMGIAMKLQSVFS